MGKVRQYDYERIHELAAQGYNQQEIADKVGSSRPTVNYVLNGYLDKKRQSRLIEKVRAEIIRFPDFAKRLLEEMRHE